MDSPPPQRGAHTENHGQRRDEGDECASGRAQKTANNVDIHSRCMLGNALEGRDAPCFPLVRTG